MKLLSKIPISKIELISLLLSYIFSISIADIILRISFIMTLYICTKLFLRNILNFDFLPY